MTTNKATSEPRREHKAGCPAGGGYGNGVEPCICTDSSAALIEGGFKHVTSEQANPAPAARPTPRDDILRIAKLWVAGAATKSEDLRIAQALIDAESDLAAANARCAELGQELLACRRDHVDVMVADLTSTDRAETLQRELIAEQDRNAAWQIQWDALQRELTAANARCAELERRLLGDDK